MKMICLYAAVFALSLASAAGQAKTLTTDPLTGLPVNSATSPGNGFGNQPTNMPDAQICKSKFQGNFYSLFNIKLDEAVAWYSSHLPGFKKIQGYESGHAQIGFYKPDGTVLVIISGNPGKEGGNPNADSVAYERYTPGLSEKAIGGLTSRNIDCR